jgi:hypothetical protein
VKPYAVSLKTAGKQVNGLNNITSHQWQKGQSGNYCGRPKKYTTQLVKQGYKQSTINECICTFLAINETQLQSIEADAQATILERTIAAALLRSLQRGNLYSLETLLTRTYGKPKETADISQTINGTMTISLDLT